MSSSFAPKWVPAILVTLAATLGFAGSALGAVPDIKQGPAPTWDGGFSMVKVGSQVQLQFPAEIDIATDGGPLTITGARQDTTVNTMDAFEAGASGVVGALQYNFDPSHQHWHYLALDRYDLRSHDSSLTEVARDQKTGFCLVQSSAINPTDCQHNNPSALSVSETINPGFSDIYDPARDGQYIDVTGLNGTYEFIQWVNADCRLSDTGPGGHTWATVLNINATAATPTVTVTSQTPLWNNYYAGLSNAQKCLPAETVRPVVSGSAQMGGMLSTVAGSWLDRMANEFTYQWRRCDATGWNCADIPGATAQNYAPTASDGGHTIRARVTGDFIGSSEQGTPQDSEATSVVPGGTGTTTTTTSTSSSTTTTGKTTSTVTTTTTTSTGGSTSSGKKLVVPALTAAVKALRLVSVQSLVDRGVRARAHCSEACRVGLSLTGRGGVRLGHMTARLSRSGSRTLTLKLNRKAQRIVSRFHSGTLTLWLNVKGTDGELQTVSHVLHIKG